MSAIMVDAASPAPAPFAAWWRNGLAVPDSDAFFHAWLAPRVDAAAASKDPALHESLREGCPQNGIAFVFDDDDDAFVLGVSHASDARRSSAEHLIATKALHCTATAWMLIAAQCSAIP